MRPGHDEKGFTLVELAVALAIMALVGLGAYMTTFQVIHGTERSSSDITAMRQVQNAGYWLSRDAQKAESIKTTGLTYPDFIFIAWTERDYINDDVHHSATYYFEDVSGTIKNLKRQHWSSSGLDEETLIAEHIYYDPADPSDTSTASYANPALTVKLVSIFGDAEEVREYQISRRTNFY